ncbi:hypothetical protein CO179_01590 [candidate division WWE3 bacterium CG_4_9_14_3_um_filter_39_7]|uniref:SH3b domain-containing protein n=1 Tax=candidate division WWE3 bacterium CG_4_9_14_3_um_filter_39_7 TaxID=1975080 RepID=A0A2M7X3G9_UNCKA|nr:MAG: hypothetical protein CO179_01590 [candidate division WWE3 bacterium CG_4_9_14_3_um_filter_39_7]
MRTATVVISFIVIVIVTFVFVREGASMVLSSRSEIGTLVVTTANGSQSVTINDKQSGTTPVSYTSDKPQELVVSIGNSWNGKVNVSGGGESRISREIYNNSSVSYGYDLGFESVNALFAESSINVSVTPQDATVTIDDTASDVSPYVSNVKPGVSHSIKIVRDGFEEMHINVTVPDRTRAQIVVDLVPLLFESLEQVPVTGGPSVDVLPTTRTQWGGSLISLASVPSSPWQSVVAYQLKSQLPLTGDSAILLLEEVSRTRYNYKGIPFAYIIAQDGTVYEGMGLYNLDYSMFQGRGFAKGDVPVLILSSEISESTQEILSGIVSLVESPPQPRVRNISEVGDLTLTLGERREIPIQFQNVGSVTWEDPSQFVIAVADTNGISEAYDPVKWNSTSQVRRVTKVPVFPGNDVSVLLPIQAPYYPVTFNQAFMLIDTYTGQEVKGSRFGLHLTVEGDNVGTLRILDTPTGYLNVREGPSIGSKLITTVFPGEKFAYRQEDGEWIQLIMRGEDNGWVTKKYVEKL